MLVARRARRAEQKERRAADRAYWKAVKAELRREKDGRNYLRNLANIEQSERMIRWAEEDSGPMSRLDGPEK